MRYIIIGIIGSILLFFSCQSETVLSDSQVINIQRMDREIFEISDQQELNRFTSSHQELSKLYFQNILGFEEFGNDIPYTELQKFKNDSLIQSLSQLVQSKYQTLDDTEIKLSKTFQRIQEYFPYISTPEVYSFISGLNYQVFLFQNDQDQSSVGLSLDMFLGDAFDYRRLAHFNPAFSQYISRTFNRDHIPKKVTDAMLSEVLPKEKGLNLLDQMLHNGKNLYITHRILDGIVSDTVIMEYTRTQWEWCNENEKEIWAFFVSEDLFYETDFMTITKYVNPSPHAPGMPEEAPGRVGNYIGWKIIESFMREHPEYSIEELLKITDSQRIFKESNYKP